MPTLSDFIDRVQRDFGGELGTTEGLVGPRGPERLSRIVRPNKRFAILPDIRVGDLLLPSMVRSLCAQLGIPSEAFGLKSPPNN